jgi:hypothetical protein
LFDGVGSFYLFFFFIFLLVFELDGLFSSVIVFRGSVGEDGSVGELEEVD